jgi:hypothetical protein
MKTKISIEAAPVIIDAIFCQINSMRLNVLKSRVEWSEKASAYPL